MNKIIKHRAKIKNMPSEFCAKDGSVNMSKVIRHLMSGIPTKNRNSKTRHRFEELFCRKNADGSRGYQSRGGIADLCVSISNLKCIIENLAQQVKALEDERAMSKHWREYHYHGVGAQKTGMPQHSV